MDVARHLLILRQHNTDFMDEVFVDAEEEVNPEEDGSETTEHCRELSGQQQEGSTGEDNAGREKSEGSRRPPS